MKKIIALIFIFFLTFSCSNELEFNEHALQGLKNYNSWIADSFQAALSDDGSLRIIGVKDNESLVLSTMSANSGSYNLESSLVNSVDFDDGGLFTYSTSNGGDGEIVINDYDTIASTVSGTFKFNAYSSDDDIVNFIKGVFRRVPIAGLDQTEEFVGSNSFGVSVNSISVQVSTIESKVESPVLSIKATTFEDTSIEIFMPEDIISGSYTLNSSSQIYANYIDSDGNVAFSQYGTLTILEHNTLFNKITASFLFNTGNPYNVAVSDGSFIVYY